MSTIIMSSVAALQLFVSQDALRRDQGGALELLPCRFFPPLNSIVQNPQFVDDSMHLASGIEFI